MTLLDLLFLRVTDVFFLSIAVTCISRAYMHACEHGVTGAFLRLRTHCMCTCTFMLLQKTVDISGGIRERKISTIVNPLFMLKSDDAASGVVSVPLKVVSATPVR